MKEKKNTELYEVEVIWKMKGKIFIEAENKDELEKILNRDLQELMVPEISEEVKGSISVINIK